MISQGQDGVGVSVTAFSQFRPPGEPKERRPRHPRWRSLTGCGLPAGAVRFSLPRLCSQREPKEYRRPRWSWRSQTGDSGRISARPHYSLSPRSSAAGGGGLFAQALKTKMPPKPFRNLGEKMEGVKVTRAGRGKGEQTGSNKRLTSAVAKPAVENTLRGVKTSMPESEDSQREVRERNSGSYTEIKQPQAQQFDWSGQLEYRDGEGGASILKSTTEEENLHKTFSNTKTLGKIAGKDSQLVEWGKDNSDKFYSLTEESDLSSGDHSLGGSEDSEASETEDKTSSNEPTVRQWRRQRKLVKARPSALGSPGNPSSMGGRNLKWDYAGIGLTDSSSITLTNQGSANGNKEGNKESDIDPLLIAHPHWGLRQECCSQFITQSRSCKQKQGSKVDVQGLPRRDYREQFVK
ncbi:hypothetical protein NDU88_008714 [Pleurodeles waltl]|uniref:Uncharacterized protein n=1 Tax=Pleurodeles waltl TaxID=8319 RepID=A0AAV7QQI2_PLEWA|nr:hypothetical protein NDU88_008714 [Pleurodeles waltl]